MKPNNSLASRKYPGRDRGKLTGKASGVPSLRVGRELARQLAEVKRALVREFGSAISGQGQLLSSALNEAEAIAWQTPYPHLFFPALAEEKAAAVNQWAARQRRVRHASREISLTA